jgi:hypothetical protein
MESFRTERGPRQRLVAYLGQMDECGQLGLKDFLEATIPQGRESPFWNSVLSLSSGRTTV